MELCLFVSTSFSWVVWEQPFAFLLFCLGCSSLALVSFIFFVFLGEVVHQLRLYFNLLYALWIWPILDTDHVALLLPGPKVKLLFFAIDVKADFSGSNINLCSYGAENGRPRMRGDSFIVSMSSTMKSTGMKYPWIFIETFLAILAR